MTFYQLGFFFMAGAFVSTVFLAIALSLRIRRIYNLLREHREYYSALRGSSAVITEYPSSSCIAVCRYYKGRRFDIKRFSYTPGDSDDYLYKVMLAEELRDKYNEEP